jgi:hypothetical protein
MLPTLAQAFDVRAIARAIGPYTIDRLKASMDGGRAPEIDTAKINQLLADLPGDQTMNSVSRARGCCPPSTSSVVSLTWVRRIAAADRCAGAMPRTSVSAAHE